jgi:hypothetical protein
MAMGYMTMIRELLDHFEANAHLGLLIVEENESLPLVSEILNAEGYRQAVECRDVLQILQTGNSCSFIVSDKLEATVPIYLAASRNSRRSVRSIGSSDGDKIEHEESASEIMTMQNEQSRLLVLFERKLFEKLDKQIQLSREIPWLGSFSGKRTQAALYGNGA